MFEQEIESIAAGGSNEEIYYDLLESDRKEHIDQKGRIEGKKKVILHIGRVSDRKAYYLTI